MFMMLVGRTILVVALVTAFGSFWSAPEAEARNLRGTIAAPGDVFGGVVAAALQPLGNAIGTQVANQIPTISTSAGFTFEYDPSLEVYVRSTQTFGPLFAERAATIGKGRFNVNASYTYLDFKEFNGKSLDHLVSRSETAALNAGTAFAGLARPDLATRFPTIASSSIFTRGTLDLDIEAQLMDFGFTYGVLDNLDVNLDVPVVRTFVRSRFHQETLDPRFVELFDLPPSFAGQVTSTNVAREDAFGVGDIRLRGKYLFLTNPLRMAALLDLALPTGSPGNLQGTGDTRLGTTLIVSQVYRGVIEPHAQAGVEFNCDDVDRSQAKYLVGVDVQFGWVSTNIDFIGRSEFGPLGRIPNEGRLPKVEDGEFVETAPPFTGRPLFVNIDRNDILDLSLGAKVQILPNGVFYLAFTLPLNNDGIRTDFTPTFGLEATF